MEEIKEIGKLQEMEEIGKLQLKSIKKMEKNLVIGISSAFGTFIIIVIIVVTIIIMRARKNVWDVHLPTKALNFDQIEFRSGDILLCSGSSVNDALNKIVGKCMYSHVALVYVDAESKRPYLWDIDNIAARFLPLKSFLDYYKGRVCVRQLSSFTKFIDNNKYAQHVKKVFGAPYTYDFWISGYNRLFPAMALPFQNNTDLVNIEKSRIDNGIEKNGKSKRRNYFCCVHVAETLEELGVLDFGHDENMDKKYLLSIKDFTTDDCLLPLVKGWFYESEILIEKE